MPNIGSLLSHNEIRDGMTGGLEMVWLVEVSLLIMYLGLKWDEWLVCKGGGSAWGVISSLLLNLCFSFVLFKIPQLISLIYQLKDYMFFMMDTVFFFLVGLKYTVVWSIFILTWLSALCTRPGLFLCYFIMFWHDYPTLVISNGCVWN